MIDYEVDNGVALIAMESPPVNALGLRMRVALMQKLTEAYSEQSVKVVIIASKLKLFCGGADIEEFKSGALWSKPDLHELIEAIEQSPKVVIAAINGFAMGGALELALACDYRIAGPAAKMGLPEIKIGVFPGAGGTQRLPRVVGIALATDMILSGNPIAANQALSCGLVDQVIANDSDFFAESLNFASSLISRGAPLRKCSDKDVDISTIPVKFFDDTRADISAKFYGQVAQEYCLDSIQASTRLPITEAIAKDARDFAEILQTSQARSMIHLFFAEREAQKVPGVSADTESRSVESIGIIGAGTMGSGISIACLDAGLPVTIVEMSETALDKGLSNICQYYDQAVAKGRLSEDRAEQLKTAISGSLDIAALAEVDLVIEAAFEDMAVKRSLFEKLGQVCKPTAILASNTSTLDLDDIAAASNRPADVIGLHFFSPANKMRLLEIVRGEKTAASVIKTALQFAKQIRKISMVAGVCYGFVGNRMLEPYFRESSRLLLEGAEPAQVDRVLTEFGMAMGPLSVADLAGIDVGYRIRESRREEILQDPSYQAIQDKLFELDRYGQKTGRGFYHYQGRKRSDDAEVIDLCRQLADQHGIQRRDISDQEILQRCIYPLINEGIQILAEGIAYRSGDCDIAWVNGYGFPAWRGGPLYYADEIGLDQVLTGMNQYRKQLGAYGQMWFKPAELLEKLVKDHDNLRAFVAVHLTQELK